MNGTRPDFCSSFRLAPPSKNAVIYQALPDQNNSHLISVMYLPVTDAQERKYAWGWSFINCERYRNNNLLRFLHSYQIIVMQNYIMHLVMHPSILDCDYSSQRADHVAKDEVTKQRMISHLYPT